MTNKIRYLKEQKKKMKNSWQSKLRRIKRHNRKL